MKKSFLLALVALAFCTTSAFGQTKLQVLIARSNADLKAIETWYGWEKLKPFPHPSMMTMDNGVVTNYGIILEPTKQAKDILVWIKEINPNDGSVVLTPITAEVYGFPNWKELENPNRIIPVTVKLEILAGGAKKYWAWFA